MAGKKRKLIIVATETDNVYALDANTGKVAWQSTLGTPVRAGILPCGNIQPLGITGTPVIDAAGRRLYLDAMVQDPFFGPQHELFGLSLADGSVPAGFPVNVAVALKRSGESFVPRIQNQRPALLLVNGEVFVAFGAHADDC